MFDTILTQELPLLGEVDEKISLEFSMGILRTFCGHQNTPFGRSAYFEFRDFRLLFIQVYTPGS